MTVAAAFNGWNDTQPLLASGEVMPLRRRWPGLLAVLLAAVASVATGPGPRDSDVAAQAEDFRQVTLPSPATDEEVVLTGRVTYRTSRVPTGQPPSRSEPAPTLEARLTFLVPEADFGTVVDASLVVLGPPAQPGNPARGSVDAGIDNRERDCADTRPPEAIELTRQKVEDRRVLASPSLDCTCGTSTCSRRFELRLKPRGPVKEPIELKASIRAEGFRVKDENVQIAVVLDP